MRRCWITSIVMLTGCGAESGTVLQILDSPALSEACELDADADSFTAAGEYDPRGFGWTWPTAFHLPLRVRNNMVAVDDDLEDGFVQPNANDVELLGFDVCWDLASRYAGIGSFDGGIPFECGDLPADQRGFASSSGTAPAGGGLGAVTVDVLSITALRAAGIFGPAFDPWLLPQLQLGDLPNASFFGHPVIESAGAATRSAAWGAFPFDMNNEARILLVLRAQGKTQVGDAVRSNWFSYPVDIGVGAAATLCGAPRLETCTSGEQAYVGIGVDLSASCLPFQLVGVECIEVDCPAT